MTMIQTAARAYCRWLVDHSRHVWVGRSTSGLGGWDQVRRVWPLFFCREQPDRPVWSRKVGRLGIYLYPGGILVLLGPDFAPEIRLLAKD